MRRRHNTCVIPDTRTSNMTHVRNDVESPLATDRVMCLTIRILRGLSFIPNSLTKLGSIVMMSDPQSAFASTTLDVRSDWYMTMAFIV